MKRNALLRFAWLIIALLLPCSHSLADDHSFWSKISSFFGAITGEKVTGSENRVESSREVADFTSINLETAATIWVGYGEDVSVVVTVDDNIQPLITTSVQNGQLVISASEKFKSKEGLHLSVQTPSLDAFTISGAGDIEIRDISGDHFTLDINGAADVRASGTVESVVATIRGAGDIDMKNLLAKKASFEIRGAGDISASVSDEIHAEIKGAGDITYYGKPQIVDTKILGFGDINRKDPLPLQTE